MRERVTLLLKTVTRDALGGEVITWLDQGDEWADVRPIRGREYFVAEQFEAETDIRFVLRYRSDIDSNWRVRWGGVDYDVVDVINPGAYRRELELMCKTVPNP